MNPETNRIEYKQELIDDLEKEVVAFLNYAVINAIVHNDYTLEVPPKFEFFDDRIEITSFGSLPQGMTEKEFFEGYSVPRNKELMRVFRDLDLVEHLGSGVPRILRSYGKECFKFTENFLRMIFPATAQVTAQDTTQVTAQVEDLIKILSKEMDRQEIQDSIKIFKACIGTRIY